MRTASVVINIVIFVATCAIIVYYFRKDGRWDARRGIESFRYFTVLSNALCAAAALVMAVCGLRGDAPGWALTLKYLGTLTVTVTMLTVLLFLGPTMGYGMMLKKDNFYMHLAGPLLAIVSFCFMEKRGMAFSTALLGLVPVLLYGAVYIHRAILPPEGTGWGDFYGFNRNGRWSVMFVVMVLGTLVACVALWLLGGAP